MLAGERDAVTRVANEGWDERVIVCRCGTTVDAFIVVTARYVVLIDTLLSPATAASMLAIAAPYVRPHGTLLAVNTHADWDHCWGNQLFSGEHATHPAPILATQRCAARLAAPQARETLARQHAADPARFVGVHITPPTVLFDERLVIDGGDLTLELFATPGHTADHVSVYLPEARLLLAGDAAEAPFPFASTASALPALRASLGIMAALRPAHVLYCHAPVTAGPELLRRNIEYFDRLEAACREALGRGADENPPPGADVEGLVGFRYLEAVSGIPGNPAASGWDYQEGHRKAIRLMLSWLGASRA